jgi:hypothetical protein
MFNLLKQIWKLSVAGKVAVIYLAIGAVSLPVIIWRVL